MKQSLLNYLWIGLLPLLFSSCAKEATVTPVISSTALNATGTGTGGGTTTPGTTTATYQPLSSGSYWKYTITGGFPDEQTQTLSGKTTGINNKTYYEVNIVSKSYGNSPGYFNTDNGIYKMRASTLIKGLTVELTYLDANKAVGETWTASMTDNGQVNGVPARVLGKIIEKGISHTVLGKNYSDVIHTQVDVQYDMGGFSSYSSYQMYIAKGVGIIESINSAFGQDFNETKLVEYSIK